MFLQIREVDIDRKESMVRPMVQNRNEYVYNSFSLGYKQLGVGINGAVRAVSNKSTGINYGKYFDHSMNNSIICLARDS